LGIQVARGLIGQDQKKRVGQAAGDGHTLLSLTSDEIARQVMGTLGQGNLSE